MSYRHPSTKRQLSITLLVQPENISFDAMNLCYRYKCTYDILQVNWISLDCWLSSLSTNLTELLRKQITHEIVTIINFNHCLQVRDQHMRTTLMHYFSLRTIFNTFDIFNVIVKL